MTTINPVQTPVTQDPAFKGRKELYKAIKNLSKKETVPMNVLDKLTLSNPIDKAVAERRPKEEITEIIVRETSFSEKLHSKIENLKEKFGNIFNNRIK